MKKIKDFDFQNKRALVRCDFNVPLDEQGNILEDFRIKEALPTIKRLIENKAKVVLMSHLEDPDGKIVENLRMDKVKEKLEEFLGFRIKKVDDCVGEEAEEAAINLKEGEILLLENLRFHKEEAENAPEFSKELSKLGEIYVNEAFSVCHRNHASIAGVPNLLSGCAGLLLEKEIENLDKILKNPEKPMVAIIGGKKVETKTKFINKISEVADFVLISGLIKKEAEEKNVQFKFPEKVFGPTGDLKAMDINEESIKLFQEKILQAKTVLWNGPFGKFEDQNFKKGTLAIANAVIESRAFSVVGGGETVEFLKKEGMISKFSHVSTGGGAMLAYLAGDELPGLAALGN